MDLFLEYAKNLIIDNTIPVIGAGGWGTALSSVLAKKGYNVLLWAREENLVQEINSNHTNSLFLPNIQLNQKIFANNNLLDFNSFPFIISAVPTQFIRSTFQSNNFNLKETKILNVAKGIEVGTLLRCSEIFQELGLEKENYTVLTGPSHAEEVANLSPTTVVTSGLDNKFTHFVQKLFSTENFRVYTSKDTIGCELGGSLKNVIALAAGIIDGLKLGDNTKAALITRGLAEISRLAVAKGANYMTLSGLSGLGDLIVTCNSRHSRNRKVGEMIGEGIKLNTILSQMKMVVEGVETTKSTLELSKKSNVEMPIVEKVYQILFEDLNPKTAIKQLMTRSSKYEWWS